MAVGERMHRVLRSAAVVCSIGSLVLTAGIGFWIALSDVPIIDAAESNVIYSIEKRLSGRPLYGNPDVPPFDVTQYTPAYYVAAVAVAKGLHIEPGDAASVYRISRLVSLVFSFATLAVQFWLLTRILRVHWAVALPGMASSYVVVCPYLFYARPDTALALATLLSLAFVVKSGGQGTGGARWSAAAGTVCAALALASKQSGVVVVVLVLATLAITRRYRLLMTAATTLLVSTIVGLAMLGSASGVELLKLNVIDGINNGFDLHHAIIEVLVPYVTAQSVLVVAVALLTLRWLNRRASPTELTFALWLPSLLGFALVTSFKVGSDPNYYNEFTLAAASAAAYAVQQRLSAVRSASDWVVTGLALYVVLILPVRTLEKAYLFTYGRSEPNSLTPLRTTQFTAYEPVATHLLSTTDAARGDYVLSFDRAVMTMIPSLAIAPQTELAASHARESVEAQFRDLVVAGRVRYVVFTRRDVWPDYLGVRFADHFEHIRDYADQVLFQYRGG